MFLKDSFNQSTNNKKILILNYKRYIQDFNDILIRQRYLWAKVYILMYIIVNHFKVHSYLSCYIYTEFMFLRKTYIIFVVIKISVYIIYIRIYDFKQINYVSF